MKVKVVFYGKLLNIDENALEIELKDNDTLMSLVEKLNILYSSELENRLYDKETKTCSVGFLVNGRPEKPSKILNEGDVVSIIPIVAGG